MPEFVLFNGPPLAGKDWGGDLLARRMLSLGYSVVIEKFSNEVKREVHRAFGLPEDPALFEHCKNQPRPELGGLSPRQAYINWSERIMKPLHGIDYYGRRLLANLLQNPAEIYIITDSGFEPEIRRIVEHFGPGSFSLLRIHADGADFANDSRSYIDLTHLGVRGDDVFNRKDDSYENDLIGALTAINPAFSSVFQDHSSISMPLRA
jgi:hypothetical protein